MTREEKACIESYVADPRAPLVRELCGDEIDRAALDLLGKSPEDGRAELEEACRDLAAEDRFERRAFSNFEAHMLSDAVGREIIRRHNELAALDRLHLRQDEVPKPA